MHPDSEDSFDLRFDKYIYIYIFLQVKLHKFPKNVKGTLKTATGYIWLTSTAFLWPRQLCLAASILSISPTRHIRSLCCSVTLSRFCWNYRIRTKITSTHESRKTFHMIARRWNAHLILPNYDVWPRLRIDSINQSRHTMARNLCSAYIWSWLGHGFSMDREHQAMPEGKLTMALHGLVWLLAVSANEQITL